MVVLLAAAEHLCPQMAQDLHCLRTGDLKVLTQNLVFEPCPISCWAMKQGGSREIYVEFVVLEM